MEAVDELEAQRDQQGQAQEGEDAQPHPLADVIDVVEDVERGERQPAEKHEQEADPAREVRLPIEGRRGSVWRVAEGRVGHVERSRIRRSGYSRSSTVS